MRQYHLNHFQTNIKTYQASTLAPTDIFPDKLDYYSLPKASSQKALDMNQGILELLLATYCASKFIATLKHI